ncbi:MAG: hypothetical protein KC419_06265, partial [Anaerolineales bacterium]|nr:hypothetical protein [Anaerolineales bacterium]
LDMRYVGQSHELSIPVTVEIADDALLPDRFHAAHETRFGYRQVDAGVEIVTIRLTAVAPVQPPELAPQPPTDSDVSSAVIGEKLVWFDSRPVSTKLYNRAQLLPGDRFHGPAVVFQYDTTIVVAPGWEASVDSYSNLLLSH